MSWLAIVSRYDHVGNESEFEPGSNNLVLRNLLGITEPRQMELEERAAYLYFTRASLTTFEVEQVLTSTDVNDLHYSWLGSIYPFAGRYRQVNVSKNGFAFCVAEYIPEQMSSFDSVISRNMPCRGFDEGTLARSLAEVHGEFILIHPYREGNGRLGRWISVLMALQAGYPILDFGVEGGHSGREAYFSAVRRFAANPSLLENWFLEVLKRAYRQPPLSP